MPPKTVEMKKQLLSLALFAIIILQACAPKTYYQVFSTATENGSVKNGLVVFDNAQCSISYNLWGKGGNAGFDIYNKTDNDLVLNLDKSFFVINGSAYSYFQDRVFTSTETTGTMSAYSLRYYNTPLVTQGTTSSSGSSVAINERPQLTVPPKTKITIKEFKVCTERYINCDLPKYPEKTPKTLSFTAANSPFVFYNIVSYTIGGTTQAVETKFYVNEVSNQPGSALFKTVTTTPCGNKLDEPTEVFKDPAANKFYVKYQ